MGEVYLLRVGMGETTQGGVDMHPSMVISLRLRRRTVGEEHCRVD